MAVRTRGSRLRTRILVWSFVPTTIILFVVAVTIYLAYQQVTEDLVVGRNPQLTRFSAGELATSLNAYVETLKTLTRKADIASGNPPFQTAALRSAANQLLVFDGGVVVLDLQGKVTAIQPDNPGLIGQDWSTRSFFRQSLRSGEPVFSNIIPGSLAAPDVIAVTVPIVAETGETRGNLVGMFRLRPNGYSAFYGGIVKLRLGETGTTYLVDGAGRIIYHPDDTHIGTDVHTQPVVQQAVRGQVGYLRTYDLNRREILASYAPVPGTPWGLVNEEDWAGLLASSRGYGQFLVLLLGLGIVIPTGVAIFGIRRITGPVGKLIAAAQEIAGGKYGQQIAVHTGDEIEELVTQFNRMSAQLQESYAQLEQRVGDRTRELATLNAITAVANRSLNLKQVLSDALDQTLLATGTRWGVAFCLDPDKDHLTLIAQRGLTDEITRWISGRPLIRTAFQKRPSEGKPFIWPAADYQDEVLSAWLETEGIEQIIYAPLTAKGKLVGAFGLAGPGSGLIPDEQMNLLAAIGQQIGIAVENAWLYDQAEQSATVAERARLARELHDSVTQSLYSINLLAEATASQLGAGNNATAREHLGDLRDTAQEALREMRLLIFELRPLALERNGLTGAVQERLEAVETRGGIKADLRVEGENHLPLDTQEELYHIVQEGLNNIIKHSRARYVEVSIRYSDSAVRLEIYDDGVGFDPGQVRGGMGLAGMRERAQRIGGCLEVQCAPGKGTRIIVAAPVAVRFEAFPERPVEKEGENGS